MTNYFATPSAQTQLAAANGRAPANIKAKVDRPVLAQFGAAGKGGVPMPNIPQMDRSGAISARPGSARRRAPARCRRRARSRRQPARSRTRSASTDTRPGGRPRGRPPPVSPAREPHRPDARTSRRRAVQAGPRRARDRRLLRHARARDQDRAPRALERARGLGDVRPARPVAWISLGSLVASRRRAIDCIYLAPRRWTLPPKFLVPGTIFLIGSRSSRSSTRSRSPSRTTRPATSSRRPTRSRRSRSTRSSRPRTASQYEMAVAPRRRRQPRPHPARRRERARSTSARRRD